MKIKLLLAGAAIFTVAIIAFNLWLSTGSSHRKIAEYTGYSRICVDGVEYLQFTSGASVAYDTNGKVKACK